MKLSVIVPLHNEFDRLDTCIIHLMEYLYQQEYASEIILVENGSTDKTFQKACWWEDRGELPIIRALSIPERSKALAVACGMLAAQGQYRYMADADLSTPAEWIGRFLSVIMESGTDLVIGSRRLPGAVVQQSAKREVISLIFSSLTASLLPGIPDTQCGFKMFSGRAANNLFTRMTIHSMAFDVQILAEARKMRYGIAQLPVEWCEDENSRVHLVRDALAMARDIIKLSKGDGLWHGENDMRKSEA